MKHSVLLIKKSKLILHGYIMKCPGTILNSKLLKFQYVGQHTVEIGKLIHLSWYVVISFLGETLPSKEQQVFQLISYIILTINTTDCLKLQNSLSGTACHQFWKTHIANFFPPYYKQKSKVYIKYCLY